jgi:hypothetical protein
MLPEGNCLQRPLKNLDHIHLAKQCRDYSPNSRWLNRALTRRQAHEIPHLESAPNQRERTNMCFDELSLPFVETYGFRPETWIDHTDNVREHKGELCFRTIHSRRRSLEVSLFKKDPCIEVVTFQIEVFPRHTFANERNRTL